MNTSWPTVRLENHLEFITSGSRGWSQYVRERGAMFLRIQNVGRNELMLDDVAFVEPPIGAEADRTRVQPGDVLLSITADLGRTAVVPVGIGAAHINQHLAILRVRDLEPRFVAAFIALGPGKQQLARLDRVGVKSGLNFDDVRSLQIPLPPLSEQRRIADILDKADAIRRKRKEAIALTEELLRSTFLEIFGDPVTNPNGWRVKPLGEIAEIASGVTKGKRYGDQRLVTLPYMRVANVQDGHLVLDEVKTISVSEDDGERYQLKYGDVLLTEGGDPDKLGRGTVWRDEVPGCIHQNHIFRVRPASDVRAEFLSAIIGSERGKRYFLRAAKQTTGIATINMTQLKAFPVLLPAIESQDEYVKVLQRISDARGHQREAITGVDALFSSLVQRAFRGDLSRVATGRTPRSFGEPDA